MRFLEVYLQFETSMLSRKWFSLSKMQHICIIKRFQTWLILISNKWKQNILVSYCFSFRMNWPSLKWSTLGKKNVLNNPEKFNLTLNIHIYLLIYVAPSYFFYRANFLQAIFANFCKFFSYFRIALQLTIKCIELVLHKK